MLRLAEWVLSRPVRTVLDVGCGEGQWRRPLLSLRPGLHYDGVDPSAYAAKRYGRTRNVQEGGVEALDQLPLRATYDLVVCVGMLNYLSAPAFRAGLGQIARRTGGVAYLEIFSASDSIEGDTEWPTPKPAEWYRRVIREAGLVSVGMHGYVPHDQRQSLAALERA